MRFEPFTHSSRSLGIAAALALACVLAGCSSDRNASEMTSYSSQASKSATPQLFTIPPDQVSHVQVITIQSTKLTRTLRLTGAVAYNAFKTTPVITQVGGPVSRILVVPGDHVREGQPMLEVSSPDYSQLLDTYLKAHETFAWRTRISTARRTSTSTRPSPSATCCRPNRTVMRRRRT